MRRGRTYRRQTKHGLITWTLVSISILLVFPEVHRSDIKSVLGISTSTPSEPGYARPLIQWNEDTQHCYTDIGVAATLQHTPASTRLDRRPSALRAGLAYGRNALPATSQLLSSASTQDGGWSWTNSIPFRVVEIRGATDYIDMNSRYVGVYSKCSCLVNDVQLLLFHHRDDHGE
jgi:hypothetical protein